jgi:hypothetical protein
MQKHRSQPLVTGKFLEMLCALVQPDSEPMLHSRTHSFSAAMMSLPYFYLKLKLGHGIGGLQSAVLRFQDAFSDQGGVGLVIQLLVAKDCSRTVAQLCCKLLVLLLEDDVIKVEIVALRGLLALENVLALFGGAPDFRQSVLALLKKLLGGDKIGFYRTFENTLTQDLVEVMANNQDNATVLKQGCVALKRLLFKKIIREHDIARRDCTSVLVNAVKNFPDDTDLHFCCCVLLSDVWHLLDFETKAAVTTFGLEAILKTIASKDFLYESSCGKILGKLGFFPNSEANLQQGLFKRFLFF